MNQALHLNGHTVVPTPPKNLSTLLEVVGAAPDTQVLFFSTPFEAYFHLYYAIYLDIIRQTGRNHILTTPFEPLVFKESLKKLEPLGCLSKLLSQSEGRLTCESIEEALSPRTALLSLSWANSLTGVIQPVQEIASLCRKKGVLLHVDATHLFGKHSLNFQDSEIDLLTFSLPAGTVLLKKKQTPLHLTPFSSPHANAFIDQALMHASKFDHFCTEGARLLHLIEERLLKEIPDSCMHFCGLPRLPNCMAIALPGISGETLSFLLSRKGIHLSTGGNGQMKLAKMLLALGVDPILAHASVSIVLNEQTEESHIVRFLETLLPLSRKLKSYSEGLSHV